MAFWGSICNLEISGWGALKMSCHRKEKSSLRISVDSGAF